MKFPQASSLLAALLLLTACGALSSRSTVPSPSTASTASEDAQDQAVVSCARFYENLTSLIEYHQVKDAQTIEVARYPYLHVNRFLAGLKSQLHRENERRLWLELAARLALQTHSLEINNLPETAQADLIFMAPPHLRDQPPGSVLQHCSQIMLQHARSSPAIQWPVLRNASVPDDYHTWKRVAGLYPLVSFPVALGIERWHKRSEAALHTPVRDMQARGELVRYQADTQSTYDNAGEVSAALLGAAQNALEIPLPDEKTLQRLFATFTPVLEVDTVFADDKLGAPEWIEESLYAAVDTTRPTVYTLASHTIFNGKILLQLNYVVWFPSRPCASSLDFLCGHIDGLTWRVTLSSDGHALIYDSIHNCGCYHTFFPTSRVRAVPAPPITVESRPSLDERAFSPIQAPQAAPAQRLVLRIAHRTHHIESVYINTNTQGRVIPMAWQSYHELRSLVYGGQNRGNKSLFHQGGIISGTERKERWFLWPLGVPWAGAMRQWGHHATAFIGRRHFDDPYLFEHAFTPAP